MKHFEQELPQGYIEARSVDAKTKKAVILMNVVNIVLMCATFGIAWLLMFGNKSWTEIENIVNFNSTRFLVTVAVGLAVMFAYIVLHELTHGLVYKLFTKQKLTFGVTLSVAYCGVPNIYVYRTAALCALLAPFVVFDVVYVLSILLVADYGIKVVLSFLLAMHVGGCVGDLYDTILYTFIFRDSTTLMRDAGPKQTFYVLESSPLGQKIVAQNQNKQ